MIENGPDVIHIFVEALALFSMSLDRWFHIPWPIPIIVLFIPVLAVLNIVVWFLRGELFPVPCAYRTVRGKPCRRNVAGEWHKCWEHGRSMWRRKTNRTLVDPGLRRWQVRTRDDRIIDDSNRLGAGVLTRRSGRQTPLYHLGFARPPKDVFKKVPEVLQDHWANAKRRLAQLKQAGLRGLLTGPQRGHEFVVSAKLSVVIPATRLVLVVVAASLLLVVVAVPVPRTAAPVFEYLATYGFIIALATARFGIFRADDHWKQLAAMQAIKWILGLTILATLTGLVELYAQIIVDVVETVVTVTFTSLTAAVGLYVYFLGGRQWRILRRLRRRILPRWLM